MNINTPKYNLKQFPEVYEPSEDTFLLIDALEKDSAFLLNSKPNLALEVGSGNGVVITALSQIFKTSCNYYAVDINPQACLATVNTANINNINVECINTNLMKGFRHHQFDIILFNPPYVVTDPSETEGSGLNRAWAGGPKGRAIIDKFLEELPMFLSKKGVCYIVILKENCPSEIQERMNKLGFSVEVLLERKIPNEFLSVHKFCKIVK